jgi:hypothetical protein
MRRDRLQLGHQTLLRAADDRGTTYTDTFAHLVGGNIDSTP